jgi:hypothetical protein
VAAVFGTVDDEVDVQLRALAQPAMACGAEVADGVVADNRLGVLGEGQILGVPEFRGRTGYAGFALIRLWQEQSEPLVVAHVRVARERLAPEGDPDEAGTDPFGSENVQSVERRVLGFEVLGHAGEISGP